MAVAMIARRRLHRVTFCAAAAYNMAWGILAAVHPASVLLDHASHEVVATLGMVIGLYGVVFAEIARRPEQGFVLAAVGFTGKVLGTVGLAIVILLGAWPPSSFLLIAVPNDLIWVVPFAIYLHDSWPFLRRPGLGNVFHLPKGQDVPQKGSGVR